MLVLFLLNLQFSQLYIIYSWVELVVTTVTIISQSLAQHTTGTLTNFLTNMLNTNILNTTILTHATPHTQYLYTK